jgi:radical SAM protein with 4Fe4S-binding SPASM domain
VIKMLNTEQINKYFDGKPPLISASIRVTKSCNLRCIHCYADSQNCKSEQMDNPKIKKLVQDISDLGSTSIFFTGGEPFIRQDMTEIINYTSSLNMGVYLSTNGTLLNKEILEKIKKANIKLFQISLDGHNAKNHEKIRGVKNIFDKSTKAIALSSKILKHNVGVGTVLMPQNYNDIKKIIKVAADSGADTFALIILLNMGRAKKMDKLEAKKTLKAIHEMFSVYDKLHGKITFASNTTLPPPLIPKKLRAKLWDKFCFCSFPYTLGIDANGDVAPCDGFFSFPEVNLGNVYKTDLKDIWEKSPILKELMQIKPSDLKGVCSKCKYVEYCNGGCRAAAYQRYKDFRMSDPLCQDIYDAGLFPKECLKTN